MLSDFLRLIKGYVLFIGPTNAGKTSILRRLVTGKFDDQEPTYGFREETIAKVRVIEIGGQKSFRDLWDIALAQKPAQVFFVIDITNKNDLLSYSQFAHEIESTHKALKGKVTLVANKNDLLEESSPKLEDTSTISCSAKTGVGMLDLLEAIASLKDQIKIKKLAPLSESDFQTKKSLMDDEEKVKSILKRYEEKF